MRKTSAVVAACAAAVAIAGCGSSGGDDGGSSGGGDGKLTFVSFGGAFQDNQTKAWSDPFSARSGVKVLNDSPPEPAKLRAMVEAGRVSWDVAEFGSGNAVEWCGDLLERIDYAAIDRRQFPAGTATDCGVPAVSYGLVLVYNADKFGENPPTRLADFFDADRYPGRRVTSREVESGLLESALLADGVAADELYPLDVDRALDVWDRVKGKTTFAETYGQIQQLLVGKQVDMGLVVQARALTAVQEGAPYKPVWDKTAIATDVLIVPKGAPNRETAMRYIAFATQPEQSARFAELSGTAPSNVDARPRLSAEAAELDPLAEGHGEAVNLDPEWWGANTDEAREQFTAWLGG
jgi:putative spermidine/putrescine transport system substrate-binding protein